MEKSLENIIENTHYKDVKTLQFKLDEAIESHERGLNHPELNINFFNSLSIFLQEFHS